MAYKQNNPLSRKSSNKPSPLKHSLVDSRDGSSYPHRHGYGDKSNQFRGVQGKQIVGNPDFNTNKNKVFRKDGEKFKASDMNLEYLQNIANIYNQGGFAPGSTFTGGTYYNNPNSTPSQGLNVFGLNFSTPQRGSTGVRDKLVIKNTGRSKGIQGQGMYGLGDNWSINEETGAWDRKKDAPLTIPQQQYTAEQLYDIMSSGDGMMQYIDGIGFVGGNQAGVRHDVQDSSDKYHHGHVGRGNWEYAADSEWSSGANMPWLQAADEYDPNKPYEPSAVVEETVVEKTPKKMTVRELLEAREARKQQMGGPSRRSSKDIPFYRRSSKSSPLNQNGDRDTRTGEPLEGYEYGEGVVGEKVAVYDDSGKLMGYNTPTTFSGTMNVPGVKEIEGTYDPVIDGGTPVNPNPDNLPKEVLDQNWTNFCLENPTDPRCQGFNERMGITLPPTEVPINEILSDQYISTAFEPYIEEEIVEDEVPMFSIGTQDVGKRSGGKIQMKLPDFSGMSLPQLRIASKKCGNCKNRGLIQRAILALGGGI
tara:strand:+ start:6383 stop:7981 length:1599 start_codon:yes stop_codon:yes gene_type:complete